MTQIAPQHVWISRHTTVSGSERRGRNWNVAPVIWAALRGVVLAQVISGVAFDWQVKRRVLIEMVSHYLQR